jgi:rRNA-processing protein FCF1
MLPSFTYTELQKKFCEGFFFHPFKELEQYGYFIYKCYAAVDDTKAVLDVHSHDYNFNSTHPQVLLCKLQQRDVPVSAALLEELQSARRKLEERFSYRMKYAAVQAQLLETLETYERILYSYQQDVLRNIIVQLSSPAGEQEPGCYDDVGPENIRHLQIIVKEFLNSTDIIRSFLKGCIKRVIGYEKILLTVDELEMLRQLLVMTGEMWEQQKKSMFILQNWKEQRVQFTNQQMRN